MRFVHCALLAVCALLGGQAATPAGASARPLDACKLLTTAQASSLLGGTVTAQNVGTSIPICTYWLSSPGSPTGKVPGMLLTLRKGAGARETYNKLLHRKAALPHGSPLTTKDLVPHRITVDGVRGFYLLDASRTSRDTEPPDFASTFVALYGGYLVDIGVKSLPNYVLVGRVALEVVLARLGDTSLKTSVSVSGTGVGGPYVECHSPATTRETTTWKIVRQRCEPIGRATTSSSP